jgi:hypothetical protein
LLLQQVCWPAFSSTAPMIPNATLLLESMVRRLAERPMVSTKRKVKWGLSAFSAFLGVIAVFFLALSLYKYLEKTYTSDIAALGAAGAVLLLAMLSYLVAWIAGRKKKQLQTVSAQNDMKNDIRVLIHDVCRELDEPVRENPKTTLLIAALAGFFIANHNIRH